MRSIQITRRGAFVAGAVALGLAAAVAGLVLMAVGGGSSGEQVVAEPTATWTPVPPTPTVTPIPSDAPASRIIIPSIDVDAPIQPRTMQADGLMPAPDGPEAVAVYDLSEYHPGEEHRVGFGGNAIFSGHVDYINYGPAVFWDLSELKPGDEIRVVLEDGTVYRYAVVWNKKWQLEDIPWDEVFKINGHDAITLITCAGSWNGREYDSRRAVRAERIVGPAPPPPATAG